jgi:DNA polymerase-4
MDAFYASVEQCDNPDIRGKPVVVGARPGHRGVVSACSYEARRFGIHSAMPISEAFRRCPDAVFLPVRMARYQEISRRIMSIFADYTPSVQQLSVDEAFLDMTGTERLFGPPTAAAAALKRAVRDATGLTISVGIASSKYIAKLASDYDKPDGLYQVEPGGEEEFVGNLTLRDLWGVGSKMRSRLATLGISTISDLRSFTERELTSMLGAGAARYIYRVARGIDPGIYTEARKSHSVSSETTFEHDVADREIIEKTLLHLCHTVTFRLLEEGKRSKTLAVKLRFSDFRTITAQTTLSHFISSAEELYHEAGKLLQDRRAPDQPLRLLGVGFQNVQSGRGADQEELFELPDDRKRKVEEAVLRLRNKNAPIQKASLLNRRDDPGSDLVSEDGDPG